MKIRAHSIQSGLLGPVSAALLATLAATVVTLHGAQPPPPQQSTSAIIQANITTMLSTNNVGILPDIPNAGAPAATITDASWYAWQEFIALNWANVPVTGKPGTRETADTTKQFGQPAASYQVSGKTAAYPALVWETLRHKVEIFPGTGTPNGYVPNAAQDFGYDGLPQYIYGNGISPGYGYGGSTTAAPFVNVDENSQIGTCQMFSGTPAGNHSPGAGTVPQNLVLFLAKGNRIQYDYVSSRQWWDTNTPTVNTLANNSSGYVVINQKLPPPQAAIGSPTSPGSYISFPTGTIEAKSGWRLLTPEETTTYQQTGTVPGYHVAMIRYYPVSVSTGVADPTKPVDVPAVLLGLHIIHKTASAPYFIFATFEHESNIRDQSGNPTEDSNGALTPNAFSSTQPTTPPAGYVLQGDASASAPPGQYLKDPTSSNVFTQFATAAAPTGEVFIPTESQASTGKGQNSNNTSYYVNTQNSGLPADASGNTNPVLDVNRRRFLMPSPVVSVNQAVHSLIAQYGWAQQQNVWLHYRLTNVQWKPVNKPSGQAFSGPINGVPAASYYQSNSMIETNIILSGFSGQFAAAPSNSITDYYYANTTYSDPGSQPTSVTKNTGGSFYNVYHAGTANNMGGCMGCHGNRSVGNPNVGSTDFSFIFAGGRVANPDPAKASVSVPEQNSQLMKMLRYTNRTMTKQ